MVQDELAESSYYEAALYEDPSIDVQDYLSDWEYYSDDYFDDDPTVKQSKTVRAKATEPATKTRRAKAAPRPNNQASRLQGSLNLDITSFQGVVWKTASLERDQDIAVEIYEPGAGDKVAFLENWREIFKSAQPALDKSRLRKRRIHEPQVSVSEDEIPCDDDPRQDSSDRMSDVSSSGQMTESVDAGDASNTTPEPSQSPKQTSELSVVIPVKRGRKRKAEVPVKESDKNTVLSNSTRSRSKRVALEKTQEDIGRSGASAGPVRRSARQKK